MKTRKYVGLNENENTAYSECVGSAKGSTQEAAQSTSLCTGKELAPVGLSFYHKKLEKEQQAKPQSSRNKKMIKLRGETNEMEHSKTKENIMKPKADLFEEDQYSW